jgi:hypothetical protein
VISARTVVEQPLHEVEVRALRRLLHGRDDPVVTVRQRRDDGQAGDAERQGDLLRPRCPVHGDVGQHEGLGVGVAREADAGRFAHGAVHAVGTDGVRGLQGLARAHGQHHTVLVLADRGDLVRAVHLAAQRAQASHEDRFGLVLRNHQRVRKGRGQLVEGHGDQPAGAVADREPGDREST